MIVNRICCSLLLGICLAQGQMVDSKVAFTAMGRPTFIKIKGEGVLQQVDVKIVTGNWSGRFLMDLSGLDTGIELRNEHMKDKYLELARFPQAVLTVKQATVVGDGTEEIIKGTLELHGKTGEVEIRAKIKKDGEQAHVDAEFEIKLTDYGIEIPSYKGITVAERVAIRVDSRFKIELQ